MVKISPKRISGKWTEGFALDLHTISSEYIGDDEYGHPQYDTRRTELGELLYRLKYGNDKSVINMIASTASDFVKSKEWQIDIVVPVPPSRYRIFQPVITLAENLAQNLGRPFSGGAVTKVKNLYLVYQLKHCEFPTVLDYFYKYYRHRRPIHVDNVFRLGIVAWPCRHRLHPQRVPCNHLR